MNNLFLQYKVSPCERYEVTEFIEQWHYSHNINGVMSDYCFKMESGGELIGACIFGKPAMAGQLKRYGDGVIELRRLVCIDETKRNAESFFIGRCLRWLKANSPIKTIVSYADPEYGHQGVIYKASNFILQGKTAAGKVIMFNGKKYHDKAIRTKYNGKLKPFAIELKKALDDGKAEYKNTQGKNCYVYFLAA